MSTPYWGPDFDALASFDPDIAGVVLDELDRLRNGLQLMGVASIYQTLITGVLVILAVTVDQLSRKKSR